MGRCLTAEKLLEGIGEDTDKNRTQIKERIVIPAEQWNKIKYDGDDTIKMISMASGIRSMLFFDDQEQFISEARQARNNKQCVLLGRQEAVDRAQEMLHEKFG